MKSFFQETKMLEKNIYDKYEALNIIRTNATKERRQIFCVPTPDTHLFDISTNKTRKKSIKITFKKNTFTR